MATTGLLAVWSALALAGTQASPVALAATQAPSGGTLEGRVLAAQTQAPIAHAVVTLGGDPSVAGVLTDAAGFYRLEDVPAGRIRIEASRPGFAALEVELVVPEGGRLAVDFLLPMEPVSLPPLLARSGRRNGGATLTATGPQPPRAGRVRIFEASPGVSELGLLATARALRGADAPDAGERLFVRTAGAQLDLVLFNGAPVHAPYHLGGLLEPLPPGVIESVAVHRGGAPARYDGGLSDLVRIESRTGVPGQVRSAGHLDMASAGAFVEGGTSDVSVLASARAIHGAGSRMVRADQLPQGYADVLVRADVAPGEETSLTASFFWNRESVDLTLPGADQAEARWGNTAGALQFADSIGAAGVEVTAGLGEFRTTLPIGGERDLVAEGLSRRARLAANAGVRLVDDLHLDAGLNFDHVLLLNDFIALFPPGAGEARLRFESDGGSAASYVDATWRLSEDVAIGAGLRATAFSFDTGLLLAPRARLAWRASPDLTLSISAGRHHQIVPSPDSAIDLGTTFLTSSTGTGVGSSFTRLAVARGSHFVVGMDHTGPAGLELGLDGYWQTFHEVPGARRTPVHHAGMDVSVRRGDEDLRVWATYTMAWAWTENGARVPAEVSGRHFLRAGAAAEVIDRLELEGDLSYGDGLSFGAIPRTPVSSPPGPTGTGESTGPTAFAARGPLNPPIFDPDPNRSYLRLNLQVSAPWTAELFGHSTELRPYVRVVNVLARHDALFYHFDPGAQRAPRPVGTLPLLPVIGLEWRM